MATEMASNYNEFTHNKLMDYNVLDPMYKWDNHFPEHITRLNIAEDFMHNRSSSVKRRAGRGRPRNSNRYKTQPITFDEIKEVDEEGNPSKTEEKHKDGLVSQFTAFSKSMDGLVPGFQNVIKRKNQPVVPSPLVLGSSAPEKSVFNGETPRVPPADGTVVAAASPSARSKTSPANQQRQFEEISRENASATGTCQQVSDKELSAIGLSAMPDLPPDASRLRRVKRRQKKCIAEEPEVDA